jgi:hypothetical protein
VPDRDVVTAFLMVNDLGLLMLRDPLTEVLQIDRATELPEEGQP